MLKENLILKFSLLWYNIWFPVARKNSFHQFYIDTTEKKNKPKNQANVQNNCIFLIFRANGGKKRCMKRASCIQLWDNACGPYFLLTNTFTYKNIHP